MFISVAGVVIQLLLKYSKDTHLYKDYIVEDNDLKPDLFISTTYEDILDQYLITNRGYKLKNEAYDIPFFDLGKYEFYYLYHRITEEMPTFQTFLIHGVAIALDNSAYMFIAPSGTGKSTRAKIWLNEFPESFIINGDKPLIKVTDSEVLACGTPWCGKEGWNTNTMIPLRACFLLERAEENQETIVKEMNYKDIFPKILEQTYLSSNPNTTRKILRLLSSLENTVKFYYYKGAPTAESISLVYETAVPSLKS